jgi:hypothetical protein
MNNVDLIIGQPLLYNYYSIFDILNSRIGFYDTLYSRTQRQITAGAVYSFGLFMLIGGAGVVACIFKCWAKGEDVKVNVRDKRPENIAKMQESDQDYLEKPPLSPPSRQGSLKAERPTNIFASVQDDSLDESLIKSNSNFGI